MAKGYKQDNKSLERRYKSFLENYLTNGFNATEAYKEVYKCDDTTAQVNGNRLLRNAKISKLLDELDANLLCSNGRIVMRLDREAENAEKSSDRVRANEILAKIKGLFNDSQINVGIAINNSEKMKDEILSKYRQVNDL